MNRRPVLAVAVLIGACTVLIAALQGERGPSRPGERTPRRLPGIQDDGTVLLPTQWALRPVGNHIELGDFPVNIALHPTGQWLAALHAGYGEHEIIVVNLTRQRITSRVSIDQTFFRLYQGRCRRRPALQRGDLAIGARPELADAAADAGRVCIPAPQEG
jgi:hypothetical protein